MHLQVAALIMVAIIMQFETVTSPIGFKVQTTVRQQSKYSWNAFFDKALVKIAFYAQLRPRVCSIPFIVENCGVR